MRAACCTGVRWRGSARLGHPHTPTPTLERRLGVAGAWRRRGRERDAGGRPNRDRHPGAPHRSLGISRYQRPEMCVKILGRKRAAAAAEVVAAGGIRRKRAIRGLTIWGSGYML